MKKYYWRIVPILILFVLYAIYVMKTNFMKVHLGIIGGADGPTHIHLVSKSQNTIFFLAVLIILLMTMRRILKKRK